VTSVLTNGSEGRDGHEKDSHAVNLFEFVYDRPGIVRELSLISSKGLYENQETQAATACYGANLQHFLVSVG
jgi:hypothetical protein